jgi:hypothetical protein
MDISRRHNSKHELFAFIEEKYGMKIEQNDEALLCTCGNEVPPEVIPCGSYPEWCIILRCRSEECKKKKKWSVCIQCINVMAQGKKMYNRPQVQQHHSIHEALERRRTQDLSNPNGIGPQTSSHPYIPPAPSRQIEDIAFECVSSKLVEHLQYYRALTKGKAMHYVVTKQYQAHNVNPDVISDLDAQLHTLIAYVSLSQTKLENEKFAQLLKLIDIKNNRNMQTVINERNFYR